MPRQTAQSRVDDLVAAFTELGPAWARWIQTCTPSSAVSYIRMRLLHALENAGAQTMNWSSGFDGAATHPGDGPWRQP